MLIVFDLDHTLLKCNSSYRFGWYLYRKKFLSSWVLLGSLRDYVKHKWFGMSLHALHAHSFARIFKGRCVKQVNEFVDQFLLENLTSFISQPLLKRLKEAKKSSTILLLSSSPDFLVGKIARFLELDRWGATTYLVDNQTKFHQIAHIMDGENKAQYVTALAKNLSIPLSAVTVYSDSILDLPLFKLAGKAICVDPNRRLAKVCKQNGWEMIHGS